MRTARAQDDQGHGTHVAGIAAAYKDNGKGIAGVAPDAELVVAKVLSATGTGAGEDVTAGIKWVVDHGAKVVNLSLGDPATGHHRLIQPSDLLEGIDYAWSKGAVPVVAAGNSNAAGLGLEGSHLRRHERHRRRRHRPGRQAAEYSTSTGDAKWAVVAPGGAGTRRQEGGDILSTIWKQGEERLRLPGRHLDGRPVRERAPSPCSWPRATTSRVP